jgi:hypothetical protein
VSALRSAQTAVRGAPHVCGARSAVVHGRPSLCRRVLSIASADLEAVLYRIEGLPGMAW